MTPEVVEWYRTIGGQVLVDEFFNHRGQKVERHLVKYGKGKVCYYRQDGIGTVRLHFDGNDASVASMFLIKFLDEVEQHNLKEHMDRIEHDKYLSQRS